MDSSLRIFFIIGNYPIIIICCENKFGKWKITVLVIKANSKLHNPRKKTDFQN